MPKFVQFFCLLNLCLQLWSCGNNAIVSRSESQAATQAAEWSANQSAEQSGKLNAKNSAALATKTDLPPEVFAIVEKACAGCHDGFVWKKNLFPKKKALISQLKLQNMPKSSESWGVVEPDSLKKKEKVDELRLTLLAYFQQMGNN